MEDLGLSYGQVKPKKTKLVFADFPVDIHLNIKEEEQILYGWLEIRIRTSEYIQSMMSRCLVKRDLAK
jgi:hypothetical protein